MRLVSSAKRHDEQPLGLVDLVGLGVNSTDTLIRLPRFPAFNSKLEILSSAVLPGGQVATVTVACRRWGLQTRYVGKIGDDSAGRLQRDQFAREGVEACLLEAPDCASQLAFILVDESTGERTILWKRDPRLDPSPSEIRSDWIVRARMLHVDGQPSAPAAAAAQWARQAGMIVTADLDNLYPGVEALLQHVDYLVSSQEFPFRLTGIKDLLIALPHIKQQFGCAVVGATLGSDGALVWDGVSFLYIPAFRVQVVDTTGAGDLFHAGFDYSLLQGWPLAQATDFACAAAGLNCTAPGARGGIHAVRDIKALARHGQRHAAAFSPEELDHAAKRHIVRPPQIRPSTV